MIPQPANLAAVGSRRSIIAPVYKTISSSCQFAIRSLPLWHAWMHTGCLERAASAVQVYTNHLYVKDFKHGDETRVEAAMMLIHYAVISSPRPLPDIDAVLFTWDHSGKGQLAIWTFCEPNDDHDPPKFLVPGKQLPDSKKKNTATTE
jgi:hypothetical protein